MDVIKRTTTLPDGTDGDSGYIEKTENFVLKIDETKINTPVQTGNNYMFSLFVKPSIDCEIRMVQGADNIISDIAKANEWTRIKIQFLSNGLNPMFEFLAGEYYLFHCQLENGTIATDWTLSDHDWNLLYATKEEMASSIKVLQDSIDLKVNVGDVSSQLSLEKDKVTIQGNRLVVKSTYFNLDEDGYLNLTGGSLNILTQSANDDKIILNYTNRTSGLIYDMQTVYSPSSIRSQSYIYADENDKIVALTASMLTNGSLSKSIVNYDSNGNVVESYASEFATRYISIFDRDSKNNLLHNFVLSPTSKEPTEDYFTLYDKEKGHIFRLSKINSHWKQGWDENGFTDGSLYAINLVTKGIKAQSLTVAGSSVITGALNIGANSRVRLWQDGEGGNIEIGSPDGKCIVQTDFPYGDNSLRVYMWNTDYPGAEYRGDFRWYGNTMETSVMPVFNNIVVKNWIFGDASQSANHGVLMGTAGRDYMVFSEYGGEWYFNQHQDGVGEWQIARINQHGIYLGASQKAEAWFRTYGNTGWYNQTYQGGWYMIDTTWIRAYNGKSIYTPGTMECTHFQCIRGGSDEAQFQVTNGLRSGRFQASASGRLGIYDDSKGGWFILSEADGNTSRITCEGAVAVTNRALNSWRPVQASAFSQQSSKFTKEHIESITDDEALKLLELRPVSFDYKKNFGGTKGQYGLIAEEVLEVIPHCVQVPENYNEDNFDESKGINQPILSLDYSKLVPHLIKMVQIQQKEINELKEQIGGLNYA